MYHFFDADMYSAVKDMQKAVVAYKKSGSYVRKKPLFSRRPVSLELELTDNVFQTVCAVPEFCNLIICKRRDNPAGDSFRADNGRN